MPAELDATLTENLRRKKIYVGQKLRILGATLAGPSTPTPPLEAPDSIRLVLAVNGTRRCRWDEQLGIQRTRAFHIPLSSIVAGGGTVPAIDVIVQRVYPIRYLEKLADGRRVSRNQQSEENAQYRHSERLEAAMQQARERRQRKEEARRQHAAKEGSMRGASLAAAIQAATCGEDLFALIDGAADPESALCSLSHSQRQVYEQYRAKAEQEREAQLQRDVEELIAESTELQRDAVSPYLCVKVTDCKTPNTTHATLTIWRPTEVHEQAFREGNRLWIYGLLANRRKDALSTTSFTKFVQKGLRSEHKCRVAPRAYSKVYESLSDLEYYNAIGDQEFDCIGVLLAVGSLGSQSFADGRVAYSQNLFVSDCKSILVLSLQGDAD
ncbi:MAG: hypothetical protein K2X36_06320, partial [Microbacteriaceae bacterium]|nr:hypothetical protein [Microbacteriaceae bacterium]